MIFSFGCSLWFWVLYLRNVFYWILKWEGGIGEDSKLILPLERMVEGAIERNQFVCSKLFLQHTKQLDWLTPWHCVCNKNLRVNFFRNYNLFRNFEVSKANYFHGALTDTKFTSLKCVHLFRRWLQWAIMTIQNCTFCLFLSSFEHVVCFILYHLIP